MRDIRVVPYNFDIRGKRRAFPKLCTLRAFSLSRKVDRKLSYELSTVGGYGRIFRHNSVFDISVDALPFLAHGRVLWRL